MGLIWRKEEQTDRHRVSGDITEPLDQPSPEAYCPTIPLSGIYPRELKTKVHMKICTPVFTAALFTEVKRWKQSKRLPANEQISKTWYIVQWNIIHHKKE